MEVLRCSLELRRAEFTVPNRHAQTCCEGDQQRDKHGRAWISSHPFAAMCEKSTWLRAGLARALANVPGLRPARERTSNGALDLSRGTSGRSSKDRDLFSDLTGAVVAARCPSSSLIVS